MLHMFLSLPLPPHMPDVMMTFSERRIYRISERQQMVVEVDSELWVVSAVVPIVSLHLTMDSPALQMMYRQYRMVCMVSLSCLHHISPARLYR